MGLDLWGVVVVAAVPAGGPGRGRQPVAGAPHPHRRRRDAQQRGDLAHRQQLHPQMITSQPVARPDRYSQPFCAATRAASTRVRAPVLPIAEDR